MEKIFLTKGINDCLIVMPKDPAIVEKTAAEELQSYLEKALDVKYPIVTEEEAKGKGIYVGQTAFAKSANICGTSMENWIIAMRDGNLILTGGKNRGERGIIYAAYHFLEDFVGVRWWNPYEEDILSLESLSLNENLYKEGTPCFDYRKTFMDSQAGSKAFPFLAKTRTNAISPLDDDIPDAVYDETVRKFGGARMAGRPHHVHALGKYFPADQYFEEHPEWWAWNKVQRKRIRVGSYCFSNEEFGKALLEKLLNIIKEDVELAEKTGVELPSFYSLSIDDVNETFFCQCDECAKTIKEAGCTGYALKFVNKIAREVAKVYPFAKIEILVYVSLIEPPKDGTLPEKNLVVQLADLFSDMLRDIYAPTNKEYFRLLKSWSEICKKAGCDLYIYDYLYQLGTSYPLPLFYRLKKTTKAYQEYGVKGIFTEAQNSMTDVYELNKYVLTHLLEDPDADDEALIDDFINRYYGKAAGYVKEYFELLRDTSERNNMHVLCCGENSRYNYIDEQAAIKGSWLLDQAKEAVASQKPYEGRVNWLRKSLDAVILYKFFELKKLAESKGEKFDFDIKTLKERITAALDEYALTPKGMQSPTSINMDKEYFLNMPEEEEVFDIPEALKNVEEKDIYQSTLLHMPKFSENYAVKALGYAEVEDKDASVSKVMKVSFDKATGASVELALKPTNKDVEAPSPITFRLLKEEVAVDVKDYYKEDLIPDEYHLYYIGSVSGISKSHNTRLSFPGGISSINLLGLAVTFPMDACDVYVSMKFTGEVYGGKAGDENAIYFERLIVVRK